MTALEAVLEPCPFCGSVNVAPSTNGFENDYIECENCGAAGPVSSRESKAAIAWNRRTHGPAMLAMERDGELRQKIGYLFGCGSEARSDSILLTNIRNVKDFADKLDAVERTFFMVPGEPDEDYPEDGPADECLLNRWGTNTEEYVEQFRTALSAIGKVGS